MIFSNFAFAKFYKLIIFNIMKRLNVQKIMAPENLKAEQVIEILDNNNVPYDVVDNVDWKEYPYKPSMKFRVAHTGDRILVQYEVEEASVRAVASHDNGRVWEDACAEFFVQPDEASGKYYNFECNCAGTLLLGYGKPGEREHAPSEVMQSVDRWASLGRMPFEERMGDCKWRLALVIPVTALFHDDIRLLDGLDMRANFYKCGDKLTTPHFLSWSKIELPSPCFHCPPFFGQIHFDV